MILKKYRWSRDYESAEEELHQFFAAKQIEAERWSADEFQTFPEHAHEYDKKLWCAEGSIIVTVAGRRISLQPGDGLDLPADTAHSAVAGISGCVCYEAHLAPTL
jgi:quercetin dioxygenase-like cupin family protein